MPIGSRLEQGRGVIQGGGGPGISDIHLDFLLMTPNRPPPPPLLPYMVILNHMTEAVIFDKHFGSF
jgi:hypothetical protein